jgi:hypothetical protein
MCQNECIAVSVDLALHNILSVTTKYINLLNITASNILKNVFVYNSVYCMNPIFY